LFLRHSKRIDDFPLPLVEWFSPLEGVRFFDRAMGTLPEIVPLGGIYFVLLSGNCTSGVFSFSFWATCRVEPDSSFMASRFTFSIVAAFARSSSSISAVSAVLK